MTAKPDHDWHLRDWMEHFGKRQAALVNELGWDKATASFIWNSKQPYRRKLVNEIATWLGIEPYELLMQPADALALREIRRSARTIAAQEDGRPFEHPPASAGAVPAKMGRRKG
jgi:transcriptional regulator with XRE-family HTH domain